MGPLTPGALAVGAQSSVSGLLRKGQQRRPPTRRIVVVAANKKDTDSSPSKQSTPDELLRAKNWISLLSEGAKQASSLAVVMGNRFNETLSETTKRKANTAQSKTTVASDAGSSRSLSSSSATASSSTSTVRKTETVQTQSSAANGYGGPAGGAAAPKQLETGQLRVRFQTQVVLDPHNACSCHHLGPRGCLRGISQPSGD